MPRTCPDCRYLLSECSCINETESEGNQFMDFGDALIVIKDGGRVSRSGWNGAFLYLVPGSTFQVNRPPLLGIYPEGTEINYRPHIDIRADDGSCSPWQPSQDALMADDWHEI